MSGTYTQDALKQMKGQAVKDIWHSMIGKPAGIKNTTGLKNSEEIIQAILEGQKNPEFLKKFTVRAPKQSVGVEQKEEMPPKSGNPQPEKEKKKRGPKPKEKSDTTPSPAPVIRTKTQVLAYESADIPERALEIKRIVVKKLITDENEYFLDVQTKKLYSVNDGRPGNYVGLWNAETREVQEE